MGGRLVAGVSRARARRTRCLGIEGTGQVAATRELDDALRYLAATPYRHDVTPGATPAEAQRADSRLTGRPAPPGPSGAGDRAARRFRPGP